MDIYGNIKLKLDLVLKRKCQTIWSEESVATFKDLKKKI